MPPKRGNKYGDTDSSGSTIKKIKVVRGGEDANIATDAQLLVAFFHITECLSCWL